MAPSPEGSDDANNRLTNIFRGSVSQILPNPKRSVRRVSVMLQEGGDDEPPETYSFSLGDPVQNEDTKQGVYRNKVGKFVNCGPIQFIMTLLIIGNAILLGVFTFEEVRNNYELMNTLEWLDLAFLISFTIEFCLQFFYLGPTFLRHTWLIFDLVVITFSWAFIDGSTGGLRSMRIFRVLSLVSKWKSLQDLVRAVGHTLPRLASIFICLLLIFYVYMVLCTTLYIDLYAEGYLNWPYFSRLDYTFITLFQFMTLDSWHGVIRQVQVARPFSWLCFYSFTIITAFVVLNLIVAVVCEAVIEMRIEEKKEKIEEKSHNNKTGDKENAPIDDMIWQQEELLLVQGKLEKTLDKIMKRI